MPDSNHGRRASDHTRGVSVLRWMSTYSGGLWALTAVLTAVVACALALTTSGRQSAGERQDASLAREACRRAKVTIPIQLKVLMDAEHDGVLSPAEVNRYAAQLPKGPC